jgi:mono/diheme cytochrome c family protein
VRPFSLALIGIMLTLGACAQPAQPVTTTPAPTTAISVGERLYESTCAVCHGDDLRGTSLGPSFLSSVYEPDHHGDGAFVAAVTRGAPQHHWEFGPMPAVEGLTLDDIAAITAYVRSVQEAEGFDG